MFNISSVIYNKFPGFMESPKFIQNIVIQFLQNLFHEQDFQNVYKKNHFVRGNQYVSSMLRNLNIQYTVKPNEILNIPSGGGLIVIANHITGASDAFSLVELIANQRENRKVRLLVNSMLIGVKQASDIIIPVDNITGAITKSSLESVYKALNNGEVVVIFPAGIVSRLTIKGVKDSEWKASFLKIAKKTSTPILPVKIDGRNSALFYFVSMILPKKISGLMLPREFAIAGKLKPLNLNIGRVIPPSSFEDKNIELGGYVNMFYKHLYGIGTNKNEILKTETTIASPINPMLLRGEIREAKFLTKTKDGKVLVIAEAKKSPFLIKELGRLREISFRAIGGGTKSYRDNDMYDNYYKHLILWNEEELEIIGAYRLGLCREIVSQRGIDALYTHDQCHFDQQFERYVDQSMEVGRSFVQPKYWGSAALNNLWKGIATYLEYHPEIRYTYGIVTINANMPLKAATAIVYFYSHHFAADVQLMKAKTRFHISNDDKDKLEKLFKGLSYKDGLVVLKQYLKKFNVKIPTLFKQYPELYKEDGVKFFDFSTNDKLHGVIEGFIMTDNYKMKENRRKRYVA
ncbi:MAG: lysophospholipid acyltransferase family protein [Sulfurovaceae bacterium]|nr:lysophospholipid acyltransferase family protein [Sulfurovaceae bacterium]